MYVGRIDQLKDIAEIKIVPEEDENAAVTMKQYAD